MEHDVQHHWNAVTITLGTIGAIAFVAGWAVYLSGAWRMVRTIAQGQPAPDRWSPFIPRAAEVVVEFLAHTKMIKNRTVGIAHWFVMIGFLAGMILWFEALPQTFDPHFHWWIIGGWKIYHLVDELLGLGTVVGILVLIAIRQVRHPRNPELLSRFTGSKFVPAYTIEAIVLVEGLGMTFVKAGKIATYGEGSNVTDFFTIHLATLLPASPTMVSIFAFIKLLSGVTFLILVGSHLTWGVAWHRFSAFFNIYFKRDLGSKRALGAAKPMMSGGKVLDMETADPDVDAFGAGKIEDFSWKGWLDFTTCTECGRCQSQCPAWNTGKPLSPKLLIMSLRDHGYAKAPYLLAGGRTDMGGDEVGLVDDEGNVRESELEKIPAEARAEAARPLVGGPADASEGGDALGGVIDPEVLWSCTTCGACVEQCPVDIEHVDHIIDMRRYQVLIESEFPHELAGLFKNLENKGNPWGQNASQRTAWIDELDIEIPVFGEHTDSFEGYEYLFWVGCAGAFEDRAKKTTKAVAELLDVAAVNFLVLGQGETCTGDSARRAGNELLFQMLAQQNIAQLDEVFEGVPASGRKIVVTCAHCFNALGNEYPQVGGEYEVVHHTQLLNKLVRDKRLVPVAPPSEDVTYHDPCYLGRHNQVYEAPRELIGASGAKLKEMPRHLERSMCCGAGGARMWMEEQLGKRINSDRVDEALDTLDTSESDGAGTPQKIATGCPFCRVMLSDGVTAKAEELGNVPEVVDVAQMLLESVRRGQPDGVVVGNPNRKTDAGKPLKKEKEAAEAEAAAPEAPEKPAESAPAAAAGTAAAGAAAAATGLAGGAKKPGGPKKPGGGPKKPGASAPAAEPQESAPADAPAAGSGLGGGPKKPGAAGPKKPGAAGPKKPGGAGPKKPGAAAVAPSAEEPTTEAAETAAEGAASAGGLGIAGGAKRPGGPKKPGGAGPKKPGAAKAAPAADETAPEEAAAEPAAPEAETTEPAAEKPKGIGIAAGAKRPGGPKKPGAAKPAPAAPQSEPAEAEAPDAEPADAATPEAETTEPAAEKPKGIGIAAGAKRPGGPKKPGAAKPAPAAPQSEPAEAEAPDAEAAEPAAPEAPRPQASAEPEAPAADKPKGLGIAAGAKRPGGPKKPGAAESASDTRAPATESAQDAASAPESEAVSDTEQASQTEAAPETEAVPETEAPATTDSADAAESESEAEASSTPEPEAGPKPKGLGIAAGAKRPGGKK
ncbi:heterodisulfide reductase-related iron-sulfur binding cluster [Tsukamurella sp. 8F]|uniref:(Fe-S)-binding protein n=1 Tax=unclassified Tsukamurella TaxID=2633480 RepID=UPI0023B9F30D|nr:MULTISPECIES: heterodisulfide reductase-related iron-sulfur binding cluster [unclassified Tsukamurella]MDF0528520.1 heterodisulfide reductase-related iron-sulfur binding cluster [Tsukamurella sp. 8J]MDF0586346.1 heterodisulfide reductase-related iron-sulfur binding cluster [Tsukamurella sp. 8F]